MLVKMWCLFAFFAVFLQVSHGKFPVDDSYIVGGHDAEQHQFPYMVSIQLNKEHYCGGSIIADDWILSAAHCFIRNNDPSNFSVVTGTVNLKSGGKRYKVKKIIYRPNYSRLNRDIALLKLSRRVTLGSSIKKIKLPIGDTPSGTKVVLTGWGITHLKPKLHTRKLKAVTLLTITNTKCQDFYASLTDIPDNDICTLAKKGKGSCQGDSGGPLVDPELNVQVGIVSGGFPCALGFPDIFTRVFRYLEWINETMNVNS